MNKHIANVLTGSRIIFSLPLMLIPMSSTWFYILYLFGGFTDMIDGAIARRTRTVSEFGARLDTIADFIFMLVCTVKILPNVCISAWLWAWILIIALIKILNITLSFIYKKKLISIHSLSNKITGFALFLFPLTMTFIKITYSITAICVLATVAVIEEVYLISKGHDVI